VVYGKNSVNGSGSQFVGARKPFGNLRPMTVNTMVFPPTVPVVQVVLSKQIFSDIGRIENLAIFFFFWRCLSPDAIRKIPREKGPPVSSPRHQAMLE